jgi:hypothetical protein
MLSILSKATTGAMIAGAALLVAACGGSDTNVTNTNTVDMGNDTSMDANATDMGMDTNMTMDANATNATDANASTTTTTTDAGGNTSTTTTNSH